MRELLAIDARAVRDSVDLVDNVAPEDLGRRTPCGEWNLGQLLAHMTAQHHGFAAAARGNGEDPAVWREEPLGEDPAARYAEGASDVVAAFAEPGVSGREFALPDFGPNARVPATMAINAHFVDYVVHGWDVARALGLPFEPADDIAKAVLSIAEQIPDGEQRRQPGAPFGPALHAPESEPPLRRALLLLGRSPDWS